MLPSLTARRRGTEVKGEEVREEGVQKGRSGGEVKRRGGKEK